MQYDFLGHPKSYPGWISFSIRIFYVDLSYFWIPHTILVCSADYQVTRPLRVFFSKKISWLPSYHGYQVTRAYMMYIVPSYQVTMVTRLPGHIS